MEALEKLINEHEELRQALMVAQHDLGVASADHEGEERKFFEEASKRIKKTLRKIKSRFSD